MGAQFDKLTLSPELSLTLIVDDITRQISAAPTYLTQGPLDLDGWLNALQRQSTPLLQSENARADLEAWLAAVDLEFPVEEDSPAA
jgi:hypothetical protein